MDREKRKLKFEQLSTRSGIVWSGIGLLAGILFPMIYMFPMLFSSWVLFASLGHNSWANAYLGINYLSPSIYLPLFIIEGLIFVAGLLIFLFGLRNIVKSRRSKEKLTTNGIYRHIRHPQNLGILLMILPFTLYTPFPFYIDAGIRTGDIMSWILMVALMSISSLIEEKLLISKLGEIYIEYRSKTGMFLPQIRKLREKKKFVLWKSVLLTIVVYIAIVAVCFGVQSILMELEIVMWYRTF